MVDFNMNAHDPLGLLLTMAETVDRVRRAASDRQRCFLLVSNLRSFIGCLSDRGFRDSVINCDLCIADGMPLAWMALLLGIPSEERVEKTRQNLNTQGSDSDIL